MAHGSKHFDSTQVGMPASRRAAPEIKLDPSKLRVRGPWSAFQQESCSPPLLAGMAPG